jgi:hypothetical protein
MSGDAGEAGVPAEPEKSHRPIRGAKIDPRGYHVGLRFHPEIRLDKSKRAYDFASMLSDYVRFETAKCESHKWVFEEAIGGDLAGRLVLTVLPDSIKIDIQDPLKRGEWVENRSQTILEKFWEFFKPALLLNHEITVRGVLPIDGDARTFLAMHVMRMDPDRVDSFGRPMHLLGIRFFFPPYAAQNEEGKYQAVNWHVAVRAESLMEDPGKLFLEADATWLDTKPWADKTASEVVGHFETVMNYLGSNVMQFLQHDSGDGSSANNVEEDN